MPHTLEHTYVSAADRIHYKSRFGIRARARSRDEAVDVIEGTRQTLMYGGFHLTKYVMNDAQLLQTVDVENRAKEVKEIAPQMSSKALGNKWDVTDDVFFFIPVKTVSHQLLSPGEAC